MVLCNLFIMIKKAEWKKKNQPSKTPTVIRAEKLEHSY